MLIMSRPSVATLFPYTTLFRSACSGAANAPISDNLVRIGVLGDLSGVYADLGGPGDVVAARMAVEDFGGKVLGNPDRKSTRLNSSHPSISYAVFCLKKKKSFLF